MFAGIVEESARVSELLEQGGITQLCVSSSVDHAETTVGDSVCIDGVCLTVVSLQRAGSNTSLLFELSEETLRKSSLGSLAPDDLVHLERSLAVGDRIHGHFVFGHVDGVSKLLRKENEGKSLRLVWSLPSELRAFLVPKGSVSLSGVSLTIGEVGEQDFSVYVIPHTNEVTTLGNRTIGGRVNIEVDMLARYVKQSLATSEESS